MEKNTDTQAPLHFTKKLHGREDELEVLRKAGGKFGRTKIKRGDKEPPQPAPLVFISGYSGTGKSKLFREFSNKIDYKCHVITGKFDELQGMEVFSAMAEAFGSLCDKLLKEMHATELFRIRNAIQKQVGTELQVIMNVIPSLRKLMGDVNHDPARALSSCSKENEWNRLLYAFKRFVHAICQSSMPVVLFIDDLQWADASSMDLLEQLVTDKDLDKLYFVGAFRSNEVNANHPLAHRLLSIGERRDVERIQLENLSLEAVNGFIADTLNLDAEHTTTLSDAVYDKTQGNIFFTMQLLESLRQKGILHKSMMDFQWTWRLGEIEEVASISDNVVDVIMGKLQTLTPTMQKVLSIAAYMRTLVDSESLLYILCQEGCEMNTSSLAELLNDALEEGLLEITRNDDVKFAHDRIKQASHNLVEEGIERNEFKARLGQYLITIANSEKGQDWMYFVAADHLNAVATRGIDTLELIELNAKVGQMAVQVSALVPASEYLHVAMTLLTRLNGYWEHQYDLSFSIYRSAADVHLILGHFEKGRIICNELLLNVKHDKDKMRAYLSLGKALGRHARHKEALDYNLKALYLAKEFPKRMILGHVVKELRKIRRFFNNNTDYEIIMLPMKTDEKKLLAQEHLLQMGLRAFHCADHARLVLAILRSLSLIKSAGLCAFSTSCFSGYAMLLSALGDQTGATRMVRLSESILAKTDSKHLEGLVLFQNACFVDAWSMPILQTVENMNRGYRSAMETGEIEDAYRSWSFSVVHVFASGCPLSFLLETGIKVNKKLVEYKVESVAAYFGKYHNLVEHLVGVAEKPLDFSSVVAEIPSNVSDPSESLHWSWYCWEYLQLAIYFRELKVAEKILEPFKKFSAIETSYISCSVRVFFTGLTVCSLALKTGKRKYKLMAASCTKEMKRMMSTKGINTLHRYLLLKALVAAIKKKKDTKECFDKAIMTAGRTGFTQDAALGNELAGDYFLSMDNEYWCKFYFTRAYELYTEWGALAKVAHFKSRHGEHIEKQSIINSRRPSQNSNGRYWLSGDETKIYDAVNFDMLSSKSCNTRRYTGSTGSGSFEESSAFSSGSISLSLDG
jgi:predicted ATPase